MEFIVLILFFIMAKIVKLFKEEKLPMLFSVTWDIDPDEREDTVEKFLETGGMPPKGVELICRYHNVDGSGGFAVVSASDPIALAKFAQDWNDLIEILITPVLDDAKMVEVLSARH